MIKDNIFLEKKLVVLVIVSATEHESFWHPKVETDAICNISLPTKHTRTSDITRHGQITQLFDLERSL